MDGTGVVVRFFLNEHGLRAVNEDGTGAVLLDTGEWKPYSGYDIWPSNAAKIETRFTGLVVDGELL